jgi:hypothetical protein
LPLDKEEIIEDIKKYIIKSKGDYSLWYAGVSSNAPNSLFNVHKVKEKGDRWIYTTAISPQVAREVEKYLIIVLRTDGEVGSGEEDAKMVFAYKKAMHTDP